MVMISKVKELMDEKGISIRKMVQETGLSSGTLHRARGELIEKCTLNTLERIADVLRVRVKDLFSQE
ncbi:helix-turn-helix transcriptional regulator [Pseudodesulfovibrio indicus]|uniref:helix-turn-helix domain-containing protein n=1 Tax=Pseudodesulfovibrio indicus TaxID=1716143 RepID=UPI00292CAA30|nr:helix-turn-helix transcriptional regulator [Pseudodesulfovibrio indicus]